MKVVHQTGRLLLAAALLASATLGQRPLTQANSGVLDPVATKKDLYPADADAKKEIGEALKQAVVEKKRVLLVFGGNWCYDCHVLDRALHEGEAGKVMKESFLLVHVDIGEADKNLDLVKRYQATLDKGVPLVVLLSSDGGLLYGSNEGEFEAARSMMKKDLVAFLLKWKERRRASKH
jgi:thiol:disulfide interchange protein